MRYAPSGALVAMAVAYAVGMAEELDEDVLRFAHQMFDLARDGATDELAAYLDAGLPMT